MVEEIAHRVEAEERDTRAVIRDHELARSAPSTRATGKAARKSARTARIAELHLDRSPAGRKARLPEPPES